MEPAVGDQASVPHAAWGGESRVTLWLFSPVGADHVDALVVGSAVEDPVPARRPGFSVLGVGVGGDDVIVASVRVDNGERPGAVGRAGGQVDDDAEAES